MSAQTDQVLYHLKAAQAYADDLQHKSDELIGAITAELQHAGAVLTGMDVEPKPRLLFSSPVTGVLGDVFGGDWFIATSYAEYYTATGSGAYHTGCDLNRPGFKDSGAPVYAAADGEIVVSASIAGWQALMVVIEHTLEDGRKIWTRYAHLKNVRGLSTVKRGDVIGAVGDYTPVNDPRGDHLHYDISWKDLGKAPGDWPGTDKQRVLTDYVDPTKWHMERKA